MEEAGSWETLKFDNDYEIYSEFPYPIRRINSERINSEWIGIDKYTRIKINGKDYLKHRLIAIQFVDNDDQENKTQVDHVDRDRLNNNISNLRWVNPSENAKNRVKQKKQVFEYIEELPPDAIEISTIDGHELKDYYFDYENERIIKIQRFKHSTKFKVINPFIKNNLMQVSLKDVNGKGLGRSYNKLIRDMKEACE